MVSVYVYDMREGVVDVIKRLLKSGNAINIISNTTGPKQYSRTLIRFIGFYGATSLLAAAYGTFGLSGSQNKFKRMFQMGAHYQLLHALALFGAPLASYPALTVFLFTSGSLMFSGSCYYMALCGCDKAIRLCTFGGLTLMLAWLSMTL